MTDVTSSLIYEAQLCTLAYLQHHFLFFVFIPIPSLQYYKTAAKLI